MHESKSKEAATTTARPALVCFVVKPRGNMQKMNQYHRPMQITALLRWVSTQKPLWQEVNKNNQQLWAETVCRFRVGCIVPTMEAQLWMYNNVIQKLESSTKQSPPVRDHCTFASCYSKEEWSSQRMTKSSVYLSLRTSPSGQSAVGKARAASPRVDSTINDTSITIVPEISLCYLLN